MRKINDQGVLCFYGISQVSLLILFVTLLMGRDIPDGVILFITVFCTVSEILLLRVVVKMSEEIRLENELQIRKQRIDAELQYYTAIQTRNTHIRRLYHDLSNHLHTIESLKENGKLDEAEQYKNEVSKMYQLDSVGNSTNVDPQEVGK